MLNESEFLELVKLTQIVELNGKGTAIEIGRKLDLEANALRQQITIAHVAAKYPALANHIHRINNPFSSDIDRFNLAAN